MNIPPVVPIDFPHGPHWRVENIVQHVKGHPVVPLPLAATRDRVDRVAVVVGVGPRSGLGGAIVARIAREGYCVVALGRTRDTLEATAAEINKEGGGEVVPIVLNSIGASEGFEQAEVDREMMEEEIAAAFDKACALGCLDLVVQNQGPNMLPPTGSDMRDMTISFMQYMWNMNMLISFIVGREAARRMVKQDARVPCGTVVFTGATGSLRGKPPFVAFAQAKAGVRQLAQSMAREYGPQGLHVAHIIVDGMVDGTRIRSAMPNVLEKVGRWGAVNVDATADTLWMLHQQPPSSWTHELEVRPFKETW